MNNLNGSIVDRYYFRHDDDCPCNERYITSNKDIQMLLGGSNRCRCRSTIINPVAIQDTEDTDIINNKCITLKPNITFTKTHPQFLELLDPSNDIGYEYVDVPIIGGKPLLTVDRDTQPGTHRYYKLTIDSFPSNFAMISQSGVNCYWRAVVQM
jgi:hypothetical protein